MTGLDAFSAALDQSLSAAMIKDLVAHKVLEDEYLDYKGDWFGAKQKKGKGPPQWLRRAVNAFANAEGGVLLIGLNGGDVLADPWRITGISTDDNAFCTWVANELRSLTPYISRPEFGTVDVDGQLVGFVAVRQAPVFFRYAEGNRTVGFYRLHDGNFPSPAYREAFITDSLYADLVLRRRQQTRLELQGEISSRRGSLDLRVFIDNLSPLVARDVAVTIVHPDPNGELLEVPDSLRSRVEKHTNSRFPRISVSPGKLVDAYHDALGDRGVVLPFEKRQLSWKFELLQGVWKAAVVCTSATSLPRYWQVSAWIYSAERVIDVRFERHDDDQPVIVGLSGI